MKIKLALVFLLLASPCQAQTRLYWTWSSEAIPTLVDPSTIQMELSVDLGDFQPVAHQCDEIVPDVGVPLTCWTDVTVPDGPHEYLLRGVRETFAGPAVALVAPSRLTLQAPEPMPCAYTPPGGVAGTRPHGYLIAGSISAARVPSRLAELRSWGWWVEITSATSATVQVVAVCQREVE